MLEVQSLRLTPPNSSTPLFPALHFSIHAGEVLSLMGPSGCGKSSILAAINGSLARGFRLEGQVCLHGENLLNRPIEARTVGTLFQDDLLFPHMNVAGNLLYGIREPLSRAQKRARALDALSQAELDHLIDRPVQTLSGGQRARVSVLRALLAKPKALLLDEPFSKLDQTSRQQFRQFVYQQIRLQHIPALLVTHDPDDIPDPHQLIALEKLQHA